MRRGFRGVTIRRRSRAVSEPSGMVSMRSTRCATDPSGQPTSSARTQIFTDITAGALPAVSWVIPTEGNSDHPGNASDTGPSWVGTVVNAIGESQYWNSTAIVVVWDDWGGFYDHVPPPFFDRWGGLGIPRTAAYRVTLRAPRLVALRRLRFPHAVRVW